MKGRREKRRFLKTTKANKLSLIAADVNKGGNPYHFVCYEQRRSESGINPDVGSDWPCCRGTKTNAEVSAGGRARATGQKRERKGGGSFYGAPTSTSSQ